MPVVAIPAFSAAIGSFVRWQMSRTRSALSPRAPFDLSRAPPFAIRFDLLNACLIFFMLLPLLACHERLPLQERWNVVLVVLDAARADHFGSYGYARDTTPVADAFAARSTRYETVISEAPFTFLATSSLFSAGSPAVTGLVGHAGGIVPESLHLIAETARDHGFSTLAYSENPYVTEDFGLHQGFEVFEEVFPVIVDRRRRGDGQEIDSVQRLTRLLERADSREDKPFFLYAHLLRPHNPYAPPAPFAGRFGSEPRHQRDGHTRALVALDRAGGPFDSEQIERIKSLYDENLAYADSIFGALLGSLESRGLNERTIVILTADHGEAFGEHGRLLHNSQLFDSMLRVPLIVFVPGQTSGVEQTPIQLADLGRGLQAYFEGERESDTGLMRLGEARDPEEPLYSWTNANPHLVAARTESRKLVLDAQTLGVVAYHDLVVDPGEEQPIRMDAEGMRLRPGIVTKISEWVGIPLPVSHEPMLDAARRRQLEALGYLEAETAE